jgi:phenylpyruvate tautomerase PptA (4-oxalocrotonate tautomerase family)
MPHVMVKFWPGKSEQQKIRLAEEIAKRRYDHSALRRSVCFGSD